MAEGNQRNLIIQPKIYLNVTQHGDNFEVHGDNIESQTNLVGTEVGQLNIGGERGNVEGEPRDVEADQTRRTHQEQTADRESSATASDGAAVSMDQTRQDFQGLAVAETKPTSQREVSSADFGRDLKWSRLEDAAESLIRGSEYSKAVSQLEGILPEQKGYNWLKAQLMMAECYLQLGRELKASRVIEAIRRGIMASHTKPGDIRQMAKQYSTNSSKIRAIILLQCASKLYMRDASPDEAVDGIGWCVSDGTVIVTAMVKEGDRLRVIASDLVIPAMEEMLEDLRRINGADPDKKVVEEASSLNWIGFSYYKLGQHSDSTPFREKGIHIMKSQFGSNASKYNIFGALLHNMGTANDFLGNYTQAESFYLQSIDAKERAEDWSSEKVKQDMIEQTRNNLKITRDKMKK